MPAASSPRPRGRANPIAPRHDRSGRRRSARRGEGSLPPGVVPPARRRTDRRAAPPPAESRVGILIVEDDDDSRDILATFLASNGYPVMVAKHGREALDRLRNLAAPCMILLDLRMPVMDGWAFRRALLDDPVLSTIPVVVISAVHGLPQAVEGLSVVECLSKPYNLQDLLRVAKRYC